MHTPTHKASHPVLRPHASLPHLPKPAGDLALDQRQVVGEAVRLLAAAVDCVASSGWLAPALVAMELSQCCVQVGGVGGSLVA